MDWSKALEDFRHCVGPLCDILIEGTTLRDWQAVMDALRRSEFDLEFKTGNRIVALPADLSGWLDPNSNETSSLRVFFANTSANCHFFAEELIEFDLQPRDIDGEAIAALSDLLRLLGEATGKPVLVQIENAPDLPILCYEPDTAGFYYLGPSRV